MSEGFYWASNWKDIERILIDLKNGKDELKVKRLQILSDLYIKDQNAGKMIANILKCNNSRSGSL